MLKFRGIKEFDIQKLDSDHLSRDFQIIFSDDDLSLDEAETVENALNKHNFSIKGEKVNINVIYNVDLDTTTIEMIIYCPLTESGSIIEEKLSKFIYLHKENFEEYYNEISPE